VPRSLKWLPEALSDLARLRDFIRVHNPDAAQRAAKRILEAAHKLQALPEIGRPVLDIDRPHLRACPKSQSEGLRRNFCMNPGSSFPHAFSGNPDSFDPWTPSRACPLRL
jgi:plasmid stabilization system protein ParE